MMQLTKANVAPVLSDNEGIDLNLEKCTLAIVSSTCGIAPVRSLCAKRIHDCDAFACDGCDSDFVWIAGSAQSIGDGFRTRL